MPHCSFFGIPDDHAVLLKWLFDEGTCHVYESDSDPGRPLGRFLSSSQVITEFDRTYDTGEKLKKVHLNLYVLGASPPFVPRRVSLNPKACDRCDISL